MPNHVAVDHPWVSARPDLLVTATAEDLAADPASFIDTGTRVVARGRDPLFPAWPDVVQLNAFAPALRAATVDTLVDIGDQCDGVRCDMAMLVTNDVFARTWGDRVGGAPATEFWSDVIGAVRDRHPHLTFIGEAYWDTEWALQQQGFDFCYDKRLYDRLLHEDAGAVRLHLGGDLAYQQRLVRFVENHDEPRLAAVVDERRARAAAVTALTQTGARLVRDGQIEGRRVHLPVFLGRAPEEPVDEETAAFHRQLLAVLADPTFRCGRWQRCETDGWPGDGRHQNLVSWCWAGATHWLVVVNLGDGPAAGRVRVPWTQARGRTVRFGDPVTGTVLDRPGDDVVDGLYVALDPWAWHLWRAEFVDAGDET